VSVRLVTLALFVAGVVLLGCTAEPAGPRPTLPHPSWAPVVVPAAGKAGAKPTKAAASGPRRPTPRPAALDDASWRVAFCRTQDEVFALAFAFRAATKAGATRNLPAFRASIRTIDRRVDHARRSLQAVPARYARPLVQVQMTMLRTMNLVADLALRVLRTRSMSDYRRLEAVARTADRQWRQAVKVNHRLQEGEHRLICL
jgi:hypothetical protein